MRNTELVAQRTQVFLDEFGVKAIMACRNRGVGGEDHFPWNLVRGGIKVQAFFLHAVPNRFEHGEPAVPLVEVEDARGDAHGLQRAKTADAEQQFLTNARASIAAVEARSEFQILGRIAGDVRVEQQKIAAARP